jgi:hypothetical protein
VMEVSWARDLVVLLTAATVVGGMAIAWVRYRLSADFAGKADISGLAKRVDDMEAQLRALPTHADMRALGDRIGAVEGRVAAVESGVATISAEVRGVREGVGRVERDLHLLLQHELNKGKGAAP